MSDNAARTHDQQKVGTYMAGGPEHRMNSNPKGKREREGLRQLWTCTCATPQHEY